MADPSAPRLQQVPGVLELLIQDMHTLNDTLNTQLDLIERLTKRVEALEASRA